MPNEKIYPVAKDIAERSHLNKELFSELYNQSIDSPKEFWGEQENFYKI